MTSQDPEKRRHKLLWKKSTVEPGKMDERIEPTADDTYMQAPKNLDIYGCIEDMAKHPRKAPLRLEKIEKQVEELVRQDRPEHLIQEANNENRLGETVLHTAVKLFQFKTFEEQRVVEILISNFPKLMLQDRSNTVYSGQTPLHMAVCKGNIWLVNTMLEHLSRKEVMHWKVTLLKRKADGIIFTNTVMLGELPLTIAALTFNKGMFDLLLNAGAELDGINRLGDNVCHSLIRYGYLYPEKMDDVLEMCGKINEDPAPGARAELRKLKKKVWLMENREGLNPLQLAASLGLHQVFCFIMDLEAYCFENSKDGLFDIKVYDVTEIDAISSMTSEEVKGVNGNGQSGSTAENLSRRKLPEDTDPCQRSVLMMLLELEPATAFQFILFSPTRRIVSHKWAAYRNVFYPWWILHSVFMFFLTWYCVERSKQLPNDAARFNVSRPPVFEKRIPQDTFLTAYGIIGAIVALFYILLEIVRSVIRHMQWTLNSFRNPYSNGWFRVMFLSFGMCLIVDFIVSISAEQYENYLLIIALILGWFLTIFFLRAIRPFSFFTVLIQNVLIGDVFRFFVILGIEVLAFSTAMFMVLQGSTATDDSNFLNFWRVLFSMFTLMIGVGDLAPIYETRYPGLCIVIFIGFAVMTTILMVNALIAMMGRTCMELVENVGNIRSHDRHWTLQKLSVILFIESILPKSFIFQVGNPLLRSRYNNNIHRRKEMKRFVLEVRSVQSEDDIEDGEGNLTSPWGIKTAVVKALQNREPVKPERPLSAVISDKVNEIFRRKSTKRKQKKEKGLQDELDRGIQAEHRPVQVQPPVSHVFGLNPRAADNGFPNGGFVRMNSRPTEIDIYQISKCRDCSASEIKQ